MSKKLEILEATARGGKVSVNGEEVPGVNILSQGTAASQGIMLLNGTDKAYIAIPTESLKSILDLIAELADKVANGINAENGGGTITTPTFALNLAAFSEKAKSLKGNLQ